MKTRTKLIWILVIVFTLLSNLQIATAYYDPSAQRWLNRDPILERGGINLYRSFGNNSINYIDTDGRSIVANPVVRRVVSSACKKAPALVIGPAGGVIIVGGIVTEIIDITVDLWPEPDCKPLPLPPHKPKCPLPNQPSPDEGKAQQECLDQVSQYDEAVRRRGDPPLTREEKQNVYDSCMAGKGFPVKR